MSEPEIRDNAGESGAAPGFDLSLAEFRDTQPFLTERFADFQIERLKTAHGLDFRPAQLAQTPVADRHVRYFFPKHQVKQR
ncbi:hypothetical protein FGO68_gene14630 [Halteria grandinella]|uniref:Uncharacterized protein n=1 Tax=Halteria grandinella TaxID=5974 RepID=A0A8J8NHD7_HALGN|nr:hypothetical protein FGO68_gene14630 [Halteria grandinella]